MSQINRQACSQNSTAELTHCTVARNQIVHKYPRVHPCAMWICTHSNAQSHTCTKTCRRLHADKNNVASAKTCRCQQSVQHKSMQVMPGACTWTCNCSHKDMQMLACAESCKSLANSCTTHHKLFSIPLWYMLATRIRFGAIRERWIGSQNQNQIGETLSNLWIGRNPQPSSNLWIGRTKPLVLIRERQ